LEILIMKNTFELENELMAKFNYEHHELVKILLNNRFKIYYMTKLSKARTNEEKD